MVIDVSSTPSRHQAALDGLRGLAAVWVVLSHMEAFVGVAASPDGGYTQVTTIWQVFRRVVEGDFSVVLFFAAAALKRYLRLTPMVLASTVFAYLLSVTLGFHTGECAQKMGGHDWLASHYAKGLSFSRALANGVWGAYLGDASYNGSLWTIRIEFLGSLLLFGVCALFSRQPSFIWIVRVTGVTLIFLMGNEGLYLSLFLAGALLARDTRPLSIRWLVPVALLATENPWTPELWWIRSVLPVELPLDLSVICHALASILLLRVVLGSVAVQRGLSQPLVAFFGRISFALYAFHFPIVASVGALILSEGYALGFPRSFAVLAMGSSLLLAAGISVVAFPFLDLRAQQWARTGADFFFRTKRSIE